MPGLRFSEGCMLETEIAAQQPSAGHVSNKQIIFMELHPEPDLASGIPDLDQCQSASSSQEDVQYGSISSLKRQWGFIRPVGSALDVFFHFNNLEAGQTPAELQVGQPVQFTLGKDARTGRLCAVSVAMASAQAVQHEEVSQDYSFGYVLRWPSMQQQPTGNQPQQQHPATYPECNQGTGTTNDSRQPQCGIIRYIDVNSKPTHVTFTWSDVQLHMPNIPSFTKSTASVSSSLQSEGGQTRWAQNETRDIADTALQEGQNHVALEKDNPWVVFRLCCSKHLKQQGSHARGAKNGYRAVRVSQLKDWADITTKHPEWALHFQILQTLALAQL